MPRYTFLCGSQRHEEQPHGPRRFEIELHTVSEAKRVDQHRCACNAVAPRDWGTDLPTVGAVGVTPIRPDGGKGSVGKEIEFAFGKYKVNPDGSVDGKHAPFTDTRELKRYMDGANDLGEAAVDDKGRVMRRRDGSVIRKGAKLFKYGKNAGPSRSDAGRRVKVPSAWTDESTVMKSGATGNWRP